MRSALLFVVAVAACDSPPADLNDVRVGDFAVDVHMDPARLVIRAPDGSLLIDGLSGGPAGELETPPSAGLASRYAEADFTFQAGAFKIEERLCEQCATEPWRGVERFTGTSAAGTSLQIGGDDGSDVVIEDVADGQLAVTVTFPPPANRGSFAFACADDDHFLGLGGQTAAVDHRGAVVPLWVSEDGIGKDPFDESTGVWFLVGRLHSTHTPMPVYLSSRGYALVLDTPYRSIFDLCGTAEDVVRIETWEPELRLRLFWGPSPAQAIERLTAWLGRPRLPPAFAFAPWLDALYGSDSVRGVAQRLRAAEVPSSVIWTEDWRGGNDEGTGYVLEEDWELDRDLYPDFEAVADELHAAGFKWLTYNNSFLDSTVPVYDEAVAGGYTIEDAGGEPYLFEGVKFQPTSLLDLSNPAATAWAKDKYRESITAGADGWMADFAEWLPHDAVLASGADPMAEHNRYPVEWARLQQELLDEAYAEDGVERLTFIRAAYLGSQPLVSVVWAGDQQTDFDPLDGYPSVIPMGIGLGITGFPYFAHDIGGYMSQGTVPTTEELWYRWVTFGALSPVMRTHHGRSARDNWNWESDAASTEHLRRWADFHIRLFPYLYAMAGAASATGAPMFRPLAFDHPTWAPGWSLTDQYLLGDRLLVAPIVQEGATSRTVQLPPGTWYPLAGGAAVEGSITADAPVQEIPVFVPAGTLLALLPEGVQTLIEADDAGSDRELWLWPGGRGALDEVGGTAYDWDATELDGAVTSTTWNDADVPVQTDATGAFVDVTGGGTLVVNGGAATLIAPGGAARALRIRFFAAD
jgi:sulfoquinovosidase